MARNDWKSFEEHLKHFTQVLKMLAHTEHVGKALWDSITGANSTIKGTKTTRTVYC